MPETTASTKLPNNYTNRFVNFINEISNTKLLLFGILSYLSIILLCSIVMHSFANNEHIILLQNNHAVKDFLSIIYFNFITILTVGYGDLSPVGFGRILSIIEAVSGVFFFGIMLGIIVIKVMNPPLNSIVFSNYCYYAEDEEMFLIIFLNTNKRPLVNAEMSYILKIGEWFVRPSIVSPYVGKSVWTFFLEKLPHEKISGLILKEDDGLKFGISGSYGLAKFSAYIKYNLDEILVIQTRNILTQKRELESPSLGSTRLEAAFHYKPIEAQTFKKFALRLGAKFD